MCICPVLARRRAAARKLKQMTKESKSDDDNNDDNDDDLLSEINIGKMNYLKKNTPMEYSWFSAAAKTNDFHSKIDVIFFSLFYFLLSAYTCSVVVTCYNRLNKVVRIFTSIYMYVPE